MAENDNKYDHKDYLKYISPQILDKALHMLEGIIQGVAADGVVTEKEYSILEKWLFEYRDFASKPPFDELAPRVEEIILNRVSDEESIRDILWLCEKLTVKNNCYYPIKADIQRLQGLLLGIAADDVITREELDNLAVWLRSHDHLKAYWPYAEIDSLLTSVLQDGKIDKQEENFLLAFFKEFQSKSPTILLEPNVDELMRFGVCAACPDLEFADRQFCLTGHFQKASRKEITTRINQLGGKVLPGVSRSVDYLLIGAEGNEAWAFSCYGRKVEAAVSLRKDGVPILIVHEFDFWDAVADIE